MPRIAFLVVCGKGETMEIFSPLKVLRKVDFPTEGRPIIVTIPDFFFASLIVTSIVKNRKESNVLITL
jgi:hypothetical protein